MERTGTAVGKLSSKSSRTGRRGRPTTINRALALEAISACFFSRGYTSTTLTELSRVARIHRPSLQQAFGDKAQMYCAAVLHYQTKLAGQLLNLFDGIPADQGIEAMLGCASASISCRGQVDFKPLSIIAADACLEHCIEESFRKLLKALRSIIAGPARSIEPASKFDQKTRLARIEIALLTLVMVPVLRDGRYRSALRSLYLGPSYRSCSP